LKRKKPVLEKIFQKGNIIMEIVRILVSGVRKEIERLMEKIRNISLPSIAQWCLILVMLYLTLAG
jgi:hypothetical protein